MQRPNPREFLRSVLGQLEDLPDGLAERLEALAEVPRDERAGAIRRVIEESAS